MKSYVEVEILFNKNNYELIYETLYLNGVSSILEENGTIIFYIEENLLDNIRASLTKKCKIKSASISISKFENKNWNKEWEKTIEPIFIGNKLVVTPSWKKNKIKKRKGLKAIIIDPKMSFGTGHNETTQLVLEMMCKHIGTNDKTMLDFGCGTSVLAIAGMKLGINKAIAIDIDEDSIRDSTENIKLNRVSKSVRLYRKDISDIRENNYDVIAANIISSVILKNINSVHSKLKQNGKYFLSGILIEEKYKMLKSLKRNKFEVIEVNEKAEWLGIFCIKK